MAVSKDSPKRRKSIAVTNQNKPAVIPRSKRRPHSIVPGDRLSPFAKARRSMAPRKSILKTFTNILHNDIDTSTSQFQSESQSTYPPSSLDDTTSMDITRDLGRKSLGGRRVSFAESVHVRLIQNLKKDKDQVNEVDDMDTSPVIHQPQPSIRFETNENDYPGAVSSSRRRSSARYSRGEDMDLTSIAPQGFLPGNGSALMDEELDFGGYEEDPMDMTEVVRGKSVRERSTSVDRRAPFAPLEQKMQEPLFDGDKSQSFEESDSQALSEDHSGLMDFTMPLSKSQRPPAEQDAIWHALRQATHSGDTPIEHEISSEDGDQENVPYTNDAMDLDDALQRLMRARASLPSVLAMTMPTESVHLDDSFSTEGSFEDEQNQTINVSAVYGQPIGRPDGRQSIGSAMDESEVYGAIDVQAHSTPRNPTVPPPEPSQSNTLPPPAQLFPAVFQPPLAETPSTSSETPSIVNQQTPKPVFTRPTTPSKTKTPSLSPTKAKGFTAAFAPPTVRPSPNKRSRVDDGHDSVRLSPAKRPSLSGGRPAVSSGPPVRAESPGLPSLKVQPGPLSPSKKVPFQNSSQRPTSTIRRPSGYFARRKSVGADAGSQSQLQEHENVLNSPRNQVAGLGHGGASMVVESDEGHTEHENSSPTPTGSSPALALPLYKAAPVMDVSRAPDLPTIEASGIFTRDEFETHNDVDDIDTDATERWRNAVEPQDYNDIDEPAISIREFFNMTGIKFMDELTAPRRSIHPSQRVAALQPREPEQIPLAEYAIAIGLDLPQLALFTRVSKDLEAWIEKSKADFLLAEDEATTITPELFREYSRADQEGQAELLHQLQLIRTNTRASAKSDWYDWKLQWLEGLRVTAVQTFNSLQTDAKTVEAIRSSTNDVIPALRLEYEEIRKELEKESAEVKEIEACDQDYLNELKASIAEQNIEVEALRAEVAESKAKLLSLQQRLKETNTEKQETRVAIDESQRVLHIQRNGTRAEVFRLKNELESLENLHMLHVTQVKADVFEYVHAAQYRVSIPCRSYEPIASRINIERLDKTRRVKDNFPRLSDFLLNMAKEEVVHTDLRTTRQIIHRLSDYWSSCAQLRAQLMLLLIKFPVEIEVIRTSPSELPGFRAKVMVIFPSVKAKAFISFVFVGKAYSYWPVAIDTLEIEVEVAYGKIEREVIAKAVVDRLSQATAEDNYACLLDACIEAQEIYY